MLPVNSKPSELPDLENIWQRIRDHLESERQRIHEEIKEYPRPIPACDVQFNFLLEQRAGIAEELNRLDEARKAKCSGDGGLGSLREFVRCAKYVNEEMKLQIAN
jgi:hypothetical protein